MDQLKLPVYAVFEDFVFIGTKHSDNVDSKRTKKFLDILKESTYIFQESKPDKKTKSIKNKQKTA